MMIKLDLEINEVELVLAHLAKGVKIEVDGVFNKIREQALPQVKEFQEKQMASAPTKDVPVVDVEPIVKSA